MQQTENTLAPYEAQLVDLRERMIRTIGIHTVNVLLERAIWEAAQKHPELALIRNRDEGLDFRELEKAYAGRPPSVIADAFHDLTTALMLILARLLGREMAERLSEELQARAAEGLQLAEGTRAK